MKTQVRHPYWHYETFFFRFITFNRNKLVFSHAIPLFKVDLTNLYVTKSSVLLTIVFAPTKVNCMERNLDTTLKKPRYSKHILQVPWLFVISKFHCSKICAIQWYFCKGCFALQMPGLCNTIALARRNLYTFVLLDCNIQWYVPLVRFDFYPVLLLSWIWVIMHVLLHRFPFSRGSLKGRLTP